MKKWTGVMVMAGILLITACKKDKKYEKENEEPAMTEHDMGNEDDPAFHQHHTRLSLKTRTELLRVKFATWKYRNLENAKSDHYIDANVAIQNMGFHFFKQELAADGKFDLSKPEFLVYNKKADGKFELVAVEYGVPIDPAHPNTPPAGFTGNADVWDRNTLNSGLWTLHAWVWKFNPDGVFTMMNPNVIVPGL
jgi:hypothetical protein